MLMTNGLTTPNPQKYPRKGCKQYLILLEIKDLIGHTGRVDYSNLYMITSVNISFTSASKGIFDQRKRIILGNVCPFGFALLMRSVHLVVEDRLDQFVAWTLHANSYTLVRANSIIPIYTAFACLLVLMMNGVLTILVDTAQNVKRIEREESLVV